MRALIIDDEPLLRLHLDKMLADVWPELEIVDKAGDGQSALDLCRDLQPDLLFLDIRMPGLDGIEVAKALNKQNTQPAIIFTTAYDEYAVQAFEQQAVDYLLKPIELSRLEKTCKKIQEQCKNKQEQQPDINALLQLLQGANAMQKPDYLSWIRATKGEELQLINIEEISAFIAEDKYTTVCTQQGEYLIRTSLKELKTQLDPDQFWQIHRSSLVRVQAINKIKKDLLGRLSITLNTGRALAVSRNAISLFKAM